MEEGKLISNDEEKAENLPLILKLFTSTARNLVKFARFQKD
jgi:hypothetical protein